MSYHVEAIPNRGRRPTILLRKAWREGKRIRRKTPANLTHLPPGLIEGIRRVVKRGVAFERPDEAFAVRRSLAHGHVCAVLGTCRQLGLPRILHRLRSRERDLALAAIVVRVLAPDSKLATARQLTPETAAATLGAVLGLGEVTGNEMLAMLDWLLARQPWIEQSLANRHLRDGTLVLYDTTSSFVEGRCCLLAAFGHNRDGKKGRQQIVFGLLCSRDGCPVAVEVFAGNTADPATVADQTRTRSRGRAARRHRWFPRAGDHFRHRADPGPGPRARQMPADPRSDGRCGQARVPRLPVPLGCGAVLHWARIISRRFSAASSPRTPLTRRSA